MNTGFGLREQSKVVIRAHLRQRPKSCLCRYLLGRLRKSGRLPALAFGFPRKRREPPKTAECFPSRFNERKGSIPAESRLPLRHEGPPPKAKGAGGLSTGVSTLSFLHHLSVGSPPRPIFLAPAFTHPLQSSFPWKHRSTVRTEHRLEAYAH
jgi:hypothetical protein